MAVPPLSKRTRLPLSRRAAMERLPIHLDPAMWKPEELMEVFRTPKLLEILRADPAVVTLSDGTELSRFDAGIRALQKALEKGLDLEKLSDDDAPFVTHASAPLLPISKWAQDPVRRTAESILKIINFLLFRVAPKDKMRYLQRIRGKIMRVPSGQVSLKKLPQTASIGQAISLTKNILSGLNPFFVKRVIDELANMMLLQAPERRRPVRPGV